MVDVGLLQHLTPDGQALGFVGVQQCLGSSVYDQRQFPGEVVGVLDASVHALSADRAVNVGGIAGEEGVPFPIVVNDAVVHDEVGKPHRLKDFDGRVGGTFGQQALKQFDRRP